MPRPCTICAHPDRAAIDAAIVAGEPIRGIAKRRGMSRYALDRHKAHLPATLTKAKAAEEEANAGALLGQVAELRARALRILDTAEKAKALPAALGAIREARGCIELLARLAGELREGPQVNIVLSPEWARIRGVLLGALYPYPEARVSVAAALAKLSDGNGK